MPSTIPAAVIASWPSPNYVDPVTRGPILPASTITLQVIVFIVVGARLWSRFRVVKAPGIDDYLVIFAMIPNTGLNAALLLSVYDMYFGHHVWDVPPQAAVNASLITFIIQLVAHWSTSFTKLSILFFYRRLVVGSHSTTFSKVVKAAIAFQIATALTIAIVIFCDCQPLNSLWLSYSVHPPYDQPYRCINNGVFWPIVTGISFLTDVIATILPSWIVYHLRIPKMQKYLMYGIFSLGFLVCLAGLARMIEYIIVLNYSIDIYWDAYFLWYWTALEANGALICASAPALKPFIDRFLIKVQSSLGSYSSGSKANLNKSTTHVPAPSIWTTVGTGPQLEKEPSSHLPISKYNTTLPRKGISDRALHEEYYRNVMDDPSRRSESNEKIRGSESQDMGRPVEWFSNV